LLLALSGIVGGQEQRSMPTLSRSDRRLFWLSVNIVLNIIAASVIAFYQETLVATTNVVALDYDFETPVFEGAIYVTLCVVPEAGEGGWWHDGVPSSVSSRQAPEHVRSCPPGDPGRMGFALVNDRNLGTEPTLESWPVVA
jgi:hypothetical protein